MPYAASATAIRLPSALWAMSFRSSAPLPSASANRREGPRTRFSPLASKVVRNASASAPAPAWPMTSRSGASGPASSFSRPRLSQPVGAAVVPSTPYRSAQLSGRSQDGSLYGVSVNHVLPPATATSRPHMTLYGVYEMPFLACVDVSNFRMPSACDTCSVAPSALSAMPDAGWSVASEPALWPWKS